MRCLLIVYNMCLSRQLMVMYQVLIKVYMKWKGVQSPFRRSFSSSKCRSIRQAV